LTLIFNFNHFRVQFPAACGAIGQRSGSSVPRPLAAGSFIKYMVKSKIQRFFINLKKKVRKFSLIPELWALCLLFLPGPFSQNEGGVLAKIELLPMDSQTITNIMQFEKSNGKKF